MAKFVESAILKVIDQSSRNLNKIEKALKSFRSEARRLKSIDVKVNTSKVAKATGDINKLAKAMRSVTTPKIGLANINSTLAGLTKIQKQIAAINKQAVNIRTTGGGRGGMGPPRVPGGQGGGRGFGGAGSGIYRINASALDIWAAGFINRLGSTIESAIAAGFREGTKNVSQSELRNQALGYTPAQIAQVDRESTRLSRENPNFTRSDFRTLFAEIGPTLGNDPMRVTPLMEMAADFANSRLTQTGDPEEGLKGIRAVFKALDNINQLQGADGNISGKAEEYLRVMIEESIISGADITPEKINTAAVYSRTTGKTLTPEGYRAFIAMIESMGRVAGSSINRFVENFSGNTTKKALAAQAEFGLITLEQVQTGTDGKGRPTTENKSGGVVNAELLRQDPNAWAVAELMPRLLKQGVDVNDAVQVANALAPMVGSVVAKDVATNLVTWQGEYQKRLEAARNVPSNESLGTMVNNNGYLALIAAQRQATEVMGEIGTTILDKMVGPLQYLRDGLIGIGDFLGGRDASGERNLGAAGAVSAGALGAGALGLWAGSKAVNVLRAPLMFATGLDTATTALGRFTMALNGSAAGAAGDSLPDGKGKKIPGKKSRNIIPGPVPVMVASTVLSLSGDVPQDHKPENWQDDPRADRWKKEAEDLKNNPSMTRRVSDYISSLVAKVPETNMPVQPEGMTTTPFDWKAFLFGDGTSLKEALSIEIGTGVDAGVAETGNSLLQTFTDGAALISSGGTELGSMAGNAMIAIAGPMGAAIGAAMQANFTLPPLQVQVSAPTTPNTGTNTNNAR